MAKKQLSPDMVDFGRLKAEDVSLDVLVYPLCVAHHACCCHLLELDQPEVSRRDRVPTSTK